VINGIARATASLVRRIKTPDWTATKRSVKQTISVGTAGRQWVRGRVISVDDTAVTPAHER
jgi:hypothetical protein